MKKIGVIAVVSLVIASLGLFSLHNIGKNKNSESDNLSLISETEIPYLDSLEVQSVESENISDEIIDTENNTEIIDDSYRYKMTTPDSEIIYKNNGSMLEVTGTSYEVTDFVMPSSIDGVTIKILSGIGSNVTNVTVAKSVETIKKGTFRNCIYLSSIYIPESVTTIEAGAFDNCPSIKSIEVAKNNANYYVNENTLFDHNGNVIYRF